MTLNRVFRGLTIFATCLAAFIITPAPAKEDTGTSDAAVPCRVVWHGETSGGDTQTANGELRISSSLPQADGSIIMFGTGEATVTYHSGAGLTVTSGSPFIAKLEVTLFTKDGRTVEIDIGDAPDEGEHEIVMNPGGFTFSTEVRLPPRVTTPMRDGASVEYSNPGRSGTVVLHYCPSSTS